MIRSYRPGDSRIRLAFFEPREAATLLLGAFLCRTFHRHGMTCISRPDHRPPSAVKGRWLKRKWV